MREQIDNALASEMLEAIDIEVNDPVDEENYVATYSNGTDKTDSTLLSMVQSWRLIVIVSDKYNPTTLRAYLLNFATWVHVRD